MSKSPVNSAPLSLTTLMYSQNLRIQAARLKYGFALLGESGDGDGGSGRPMKSEFKRMIPRSDYDDPAKAAFVDSVVKRIRSAKP